MTDADLKRIQSIEARLWSKAGYSAPVHSSEIEWLIAKLREAQEIVRQISAYGPDYKIKTPGYACSLCDMGGAGHSSKGDGFHDDYCPVQAAQIMCGNHESTPYLEWKDLRKQLRIATEALEEIKEVGGHSEKMGNKMGGNWCVEQFRYLSEQARAALAKIRGEK